MGKPNQEIFSETLELLAETDKDLYVVTSDSRGSGKLVPFGQRFANQIVEVGIAEQNLVGVASGIAAMGKKAFAVSPACFLTARALEQIKNDVCYSDNAVKLVGISAGVSYGALGTTHHSLHDFAVLRAINNITIVAPADNYETEQAVKLAADFDKPIYLRFGKKNMPSSLVMSEEREVMSDDQKLSLTGQAFEIGKGRMVRQGDALTFIATGEAVWPAFQAAQQLSIEKGIECSVISMHTVKPMDIDLILSIAKKGNPIITVEEHSIYGGLGEAVASTLMQNGCTNKFKIIGLPDDHTVSGTQTEIFDHYGISENGLYNSGLLMLE